MTTGPTIVLTAAVTPEPGTAVAVADPRERLDQYRTAFAAWTRTALELDLELCVVETSGADLDDLAGSFAELPAERLRMIALRPSEASRSRGKGAMEAEAVASAVDAIDEGVRTNPRIGAHPGVFKVTGRLVVANAAEALRPIPAGHAVVRRTADRSSCDTRCIGAALDVWSEVLLPGTSEAVDDGTGRYLEHVVALRLVESEFSGRVVVDRFARRPRMRGTSGTRGVRFGGTRQRLLERVGRPIESVLEREAGRRYV